MDKHEFKITQRKKRQMRVRRTLEGTAERPRLAVYRSLKHIYAQIVDDHRGMTLASASSTSEAVRAVRQKGNRKGLAEQIGQKVAEAAMAKGVTQVVFDRRGYRYHGRVRALADAARKAGLKF